MPPICLVAASSACPRQFLSPGMNCVQTSSAVRSPHSMSSFAVADVGAAPLEQQLDHAGIHSSDINKAASAR